MAKWYQVTMTQTVRVPDCADDEMITEAFLEIVNGPSWPIVEIKPYTQDENKDYEKLWNKANTYQNKDRG